MPTQTRSQSRSRTAPNPALQVIQRNPPATTTPLSTFGTTPRPSNIFTPIGTSISAPMSRPTAGRSQDPATPEDLGPVEEASHPLGFDLGYPEDDEPPQDPPEMPLPRSPTPHFGPPGPPSPNPSEPPSSHQSSHHS